MFREEIDRHPTKGVRQGQETDPTAPAEHRGYAAPPGFAGLLVRLGAALARPRASHRLLEGALGSRAPDIVRPADGRPALPQAVAWRRSNPCGPNGLGRATPWLPRAIRAAN